MYKNNWLPKVYVTSLLSIPNIKLVSVLIHYQGWKRTMMTVDEITS